MMATRRRAQYVASHPKAETRKPSDLAILLCPKKGNPVHQDENRHFPFPSLGHARSIAHTRLVEQEWVTNLQHNEGSGGF